MSTDISVETEIWEKKKVTQNIKKHLRISLYVFCVDSSFVCCVNSHHYFVIFQLKTLFSISIEADKIRSVSVLEQRTISATNNRVSGKEMKFVGKGIGMNNGNLNRVKLLLIGEQFLTKCRQLFSSQWRVVWMFETWSSEWKSPNPLLWIFYCPKRKKNYYFFHIEDEPNFPDAECLYARVVAVSSWFVDSTKGVTWGDGNMREIKVSWRKKKWKTFRPN